MNDNDKIRLKYEAANGFVDLSKPFDTDKLYYNVVADDENGNIVRFNEEKNGLHFTPDGELTAWIIAFHLGKVVEYYPKGVKAKHIPSNLGKATVKYEKKFN